MAISWIMPLFLLASSHAWVLHKFSDQKNDNKQPLPEDGFPSLNSFLETRGIDEKSTAGDEEYLNEKEHVAEELHGGDMKLTPEQEEELSQGTGTNRKRNAIISKSQHWDKATVPYVFAEDFSEDGKGVVKDAIKEYNKFTCIKFVVRTEEKNYIEFFNGRGCWSWVGKINRGKQQISLQEKGCEYVGTALHEMMHALGYFHEQSRSDRDQYITIMTDNIKDKFKNNFDKEVTNLQGTKYDLKSIMHYGAYDFAIDRSKKTIIVKKNDEEEGDEAIGQRSKLSDIDIKSLNLLYCGGMEKVKPTTKTTTTTTTTTTTKPTTKTTTNSATGQVCVEDE